MKAIQFVPYYQPQLQMIEKPIDKLYLKTSERGEGGFGSTGLH
jgi:dUTPase